MLGNVIRYIKLNTMTSLQGKVFRITGPLYGNAAGHRWISLVRGQQRRACDAGLDVYLDVSLNKLTVVAGDSRNSTKIYHGN